MSSEAAQKAGGGAMSTRDELADDLMIHVYYGGREGSELVAADRDEHGYTECQEQADALIAEGWRKVPDRDEIAAVIANHFITRGQQVASGVTCECGYWTGNEPEAGKRPLNWGRDRLGLHRADLVLALMDRGQ